MSFGVRRVGVRSFYRGQFPAHGLSAGSYDLTANTSTLRLSLTGEIAGSAQAELARPVLSISMVGRLAVTPVATGELSLLRVSAEGALYAPAVITGEGACLQLSSSGRGFVAPTGSLAASPLALSMSGLLTQSATIAAVADEEYPNITGESYIVVNLRTKSHVTYRDGERTAFARTAGMNFDSFTEKAVSDAFLHSRAQGVGEFLTFPGEETKRSYPLEYGSTRQPAISSKHRPLAKGLKATNWSFGVVVPEDAHMEIRGMDLLASDTKRHR